MNSSYSEFIGPAYEITPILREVSSKSTAFVSYWQRSGGPGALYSKSDYWAITAGQAVPEDIVENVVLQGGRLR